MSVSTFTQGKKLPHSVTVSPKPSTPVNKWTFVSPVPIPPTVVAELVSAPVSQTQNKLIISLW